MKAISKEKLIFVLENCCDNQEYFMAMDMDKFLTVYGDIEFNEFGKPIRREIGNYGKKN